VGCLTCQEHIYGEKVVNPLEDDSAAFSALFSGRAYPQLEHEPQHLKHTNAFPKDKHTGRGFIIRLSKFCCAMLQALMWILV